MSGHIVTEVQPSSKESTSHAVLADDATCRRHRFGISRYGFSRSWAIHSVTVRGPSAGCGSSPHMRLHQEPPVSCLATRGVDWSPGVTASTVLLHADFVPCPTRSMPPENDCHVDDDSGRAAARDLAHELRFERAADRRFGTSARLRAVGSAEARSNEGISGHFISGHETHDSSVIPVDCGGEVADVASSSPPNGHHQDESFATLGLPMLKAKSTPSITRFVRCMAFVSPEKNRSVPVDSTIA